MSGDYKKPLISILPISGLVLFCLEIEMKQKINIYCTKNFFIFVEQFLNEYNLSFHDIEEFKLMDLE